MGQFSDELRAERERRGLSLDTVSQITKISTRHLVALETGDFGELPGGVFRKGFLRGYLSALGVEAEPWICRFDEELRAAGGEAQAQQASLEEFARNVEQSRPMTEPDLRLRWSGVLMMLGLLLAFGWCIWHFALAGHLSLTAAMLSGLLIVGWGS